MILIILLIALSISFNLENSLQISDSQKITKQNWNLSVNSSLEHLSQNVTSMTVTFNITFLEDLNVSPWYFGMNFRINSTTNSLFNMQCCAFAYQNYILQKGSTITPYSFIFYIPGTNLSSYNQNNIYQVSVNKTDIYSFDFNPNPNLLSYTGFLNISITSGLQISISPSSWETSGHLGSDNLTKNSIFNNNFLTNIFFLSTITFLGVLAIVITREHKTFTNEKKNLKLENNFLKYLKGRLTKRKNSTFVPQTLSDETFDLLKQIIEENDENSNL